MNKDLQSTLSDVIFGLSIMALVFLFNGDPDLWDKLHEAAMSIGGCK